MSPFSTSSSGITVAVKNAEIWKKFYPRTEMLVRNQKGRKTFPILEYTVEGLDPNAKYTVHLHMERTSDHLWQYDRGIGWIKTHVAIPRLPIQKLKHPNLEVSGRQWMESPVSFDHIRLTNNKNTVKNPDVDVLMQSMHPYIPVITIRNEENGREEEFRLEVTQFFTVTAYLEPSNRDLKVQLNHRASGFRKERAPRKEYERKKRTLAPPATENLKSSESEGIEDQKTLNSEDPNIPTKIYKQAETAPLLEPRSGEQNQIQNHITVVDIQKPSGPESEVVDPIITKIQKPEVTVPNMSLIENQALPGYNYHYYAPSPSFHVGPVYSNPLDSAPIPSIHVFGNHGTFRHNYPCYPFLSHPMNVGYSIPWNSTQYIGSQSLGNHGPVYSNTLNSTGNIGSQYPKLPLRLPMPSVMSSNSNRLDQEVQRNSLNSEIEENRKDLTYTITEL